jgi:hypothetical protein
MDLYPEALAASGRLSEGNPIYRWYFNKRQRALEASDLLICLGETQKVLVEKCEVVGGQKADGIRQTKTVVVPPWDDRGNIALATEESLRNLALYAGNLGEAHCFEEILAAVPFLPADWRIRFAVRGAKFAELKEKAKSISHGLTRMDTDESDRQMPPGRGEKLLPDDLGTRKASSEGGVADQDSHSRPQGDRQLEELSEAVKLKKIEEDLFCAGDCLGAISDPQVSGSGDKSLFPETTAVSGATVQVTGYASEEETPRLLASARVHLITMSPGWEGIVVPSKLYGCIRTGRPVLFIGPENADTAREVCAHDWGKVLPAGASGEEVAAAILELAARATKVPTSQQGAAEVAAFVAAAGRWD